MPKHVTDPGKNVVLLPFAHHTSVTSEGEPIPEQLESLPYSQRKSRSCQLRILAEAILGIAKKMEKEEVEKNGS